MKSSQRSRKDSHLIATKEEVEAIDYDAIDASLDAEFKRQTPREDLSWRKSYKLKKNAA